MRMRLDGVLEGEDAAVGLGFVTDVFIFLVHAHHDPGVLRPASDGGED